MVNIHADLSRKAMDLKVPDYSFNGAFSLKNWKTYNIGYTFELSDYDKEHYWNSLKALKAGQRIFRFETANMLGHQRPLVMIDFSLKEPRMYFLTGDAILKDFCEFERKGYPFHWADFNLD